MVNVRESQTADIVMQPVPLSVVSGTVIGSNGEPAPNARIRIARGDGLFGVAGMEFTSRPNGSFAVPGIDPGTYFLHFSEGVWPPPREVETPLISGAKVVVAGADVPNVRVVPISMVQGSGHLEGRSYVHLSHVAWTRDGSRVSGGRLVADQVHPSQRCGCDPDGHRVQGRN